MGLECTARHRLARSGGKKNSGGDDDRNPTIEEGYSEILIESSGQCQERVGSMDPT